MGVRDEDKKDTSTVNNIISTSSSITKLFIYFHYNTAVQFY
jgi:hypothetical protein